MPLPVSGQVGEQQLGVGVTTQPLRQGRLADVIVSELNGRYYEQCRAGRLFIAQAIVTAPVVYTTAAGTGGPLIWNGSTTVNIVPLAVSFALTTAATTAAFGLGLTGNTGQPSAPTTTTAIDGVRNLFLGGAAPNASAFRVGTVVNAGNFLLPFVGIHLGATSVDTTLPGFVDLGGSMIVPPGSWCSVAATVTATAAVLTIGLIWAEVPI